MRYFLFAAAILITTPACAQIVSPISGGITQAQLDAVAASMPQPASSVPPAEAVTPTIGTPGKYRPADSIVPRITRAGTCSLSAAGTCSITWDTALSGTPAVILTPVNPTAAQGIICNPTATPTTTGVTLKCWITQTTTLSLAIVTTGLSLVPAAVAPAGTVIQAIAIPLTQS